MLRPDSSPEVRCNFPECASSYGAVVAVDPGDEAGWSQRTDWLAHEVLGTVTIISTRGRQPRRDLFDDLHETQLCAAEREMRSRPAAPHAERPGWLRRLYLRSLADLDRRQCSSCGVWEGLVVLPAWRFGCRTWRCKHCLDWDQWLLPPAGIGGAG